jgi:hypothetical protein
MRCPGVALLAGVLIALGAVGAAFAQTSSRAESAEEAKQYAGTTLAIHLGGGRPGRLSRWDGQTEGSSAMSPPESKVR